MILFTRRTSCGHWRIIFCTSVQVNIEYTPYRTLSDRSIHISTLRPTTRKDPEGEREEERKNRGQENVLRPVTVSGGALNDYDSLNTSPNFCVCVCVDLYFVRSAFSFTPLSTVNEPEKTEREREGEEKKEEGEKMFRLCAVYSLVSYSPCFVSSGGSIVFEKKVWVL